MVKTLLCKLIKFVVLIQVIFVGILFRLSFEASDDFTVGNNRRKNSSQKVKRIAIPESSTRNPCSLYTDSDKVRQRFHQRLSRIKNYCREFEPSYESYWKAVRTNGSSSNENLIGNYQHHATNCLVLKAGSSSWNDFFWRLRAPDEWKVTTFWEKAVRENRAAFEEIGANRIAKIWNHKDGVYVVTARHPLARLVSGWKDKFSKGYYYNTLFQRFPLMKKYPSTKRWKNKGHFMRWEVFAQYVADYGNDYQKNLDQHFHPIAAVCNPCSLPFNYIVKMDTFNEDSCWLLNHKFKSANFSSLNWLNQNSKSQTDEDLIQEYFAQLKPEVVTKIAKIYKKDMILFGYMLTLNATVLSQPD